MRKVFSLSFVSTHVQYIHVLGSIAVNGNCFGIYMYEVILLQEDDSVVQLLTQHY